MPDNLFPCHVVGFIDLSNSSISVGNVGAYCKPGGPQDSVVLPVSISRRQPVRVMGAGSPSEKVECMRGQFDAGTG